MVIPLAEQHSGPWGCGAAASWLSKRAPAPSSLSSVSKALRSLSFVKTRYLSAVECRQLCSVRTMLPPLTAQARLTWQHNVATVTHVIMTQRCHPTSSLDGATALRTFTAHWPLTQSKMKR